MKKVFLICVISLATWSCGGGGDDSWSSAQQQTFLDGCMSSGVQTDEKKDLCRCTLNPIMERYSFDEYAKEEAKMMLGNASEDFTNFIVEISFGCAGLDVPSSADY